MAEEPRGSFWESLRLWLTAVGIPLVLAIAGFWQFYLKEVWWPAAAINLTTEVSIKEAGISAKPSTEARNLEAIELTITARNPSSTTVYLCSNYWVARAYTVSAPKQEKGGDWAEDMTKAISSDTGYYMGKHYMAKGGALVAGGQAFKDTSLHPNEKISAQFIFYIPQGRYDFLEVSTMVPTTSRESPARSHTSAIKVNYKWNADTLAITGSYARVMPNGTQEEIQTDANGELPNSEERYYGFQGALSVATLSLWQSAKSVRDQLDVNVTNTSPLWVRQWQERRRSGAQGD